MAEEFKVTPWEVTGDIDYDVLMKKFGTTPIDDKLIQRISKHCEPHPMLRRGIFYSHRDVDILMDEYEKGNEFYIYTGRGPSGNTHLGHIMPWILNKWMQDTFKCKMLFQMTDDEKFLFKDLTLHDTRNMAYENALDFVALGFDPEKTKIIVDTENIKTLLQYAKDIEEAGAWALLVEGVPAVTGKVIKKQCSFPVYGIGAGSHVDGQLIIYADMVGYYDDFTPKFVKKYAEVGKVLQDAFETYVKEVHEGVFPDDAVHAYKIDPEVEAEVEGWIKDME